MIRSRCVVATRSRGRPWWPERKARSGARAGRTPGRVTGAPPQRSPEAGGAYSKSLLGIWYLRTVTPTIPPANPAGRVLFPRARGGSPLVVVPGEEALVLLPRAEMG